MTNEGPDDATDAAIDFQLAPANAGGSGAIENIGSSFGWTCAGTNCQAASMIAGAQAVFTLSVNLLDGDLELTGDASSATVDPAWSNDKAAIFFGLQPDPGHIFEDSFEWPASEAF